LEIDVKKIFILNENHNKEKINHSLDLKKYIQSEFLLLEEISFEQLSEKKFVNNEFLLIFFSFDDWVKDDWLEFVTKYNNLVVLLNDIVEDSLTLHEYFDSKNILKIIVPSVISLKYLRSEAKFKSNKIKYLPMINDLPMYDFGENDLNQYHFPSILISSHFSKDKNYTTILSAISVLKVKYPHVLLIINLKSDLKYYWDIQELQNRIFELGLNDNVKLFVNSSKNYSSFYKYCDMIFVVPKNKKKLYYNTTIDAIKSRKIVIAPHVPFNLDLSRQEAGILLYSAFNEDENDNIKNIIDAIMLIIKNKDLRQILENQNNDFVKKINNEEIIGHYVDFFLQLKNTKKVKMKND